ncbi:MAG: DUF6266 family protein [Ferruginibacter sp.]
MGKISKGILGGFSGTVGTVIGGSWKGIDYMRSQPARRTRRSSEAQLQQQAKFALAIKFVQTMAGLFMISFRNNAVRMTGTNNAQAYTLKNCITGVYPAYTIDYSRVLVSRGDLPNGGNPASAAQPAGIVRFSWVDNSGVGRALPTDKAILVVYCPADNAALYTTGSAARSALLDDMDASIFTGKQVETYLGFISEDGKEIAQSFYTGTLTVL